MNTVSVSDTRYLPVTLTEEETLDRSRSLASLNQQRSEKEREKAEYTKRLGDIIKGLGVQIDDLSNVVTSGEETRGVSCRKEYHSPTVGECKIVRLDTEEVVEQRAMFNHEIEQANDLIQLKLDFDEA